MIVALMMIFGAAMIIGGLGLLAFFWALARGQYDDPEGDARRILIDDPE